MNADFLPEQVPLSAIEKPRALYEDKHLLVLFKPHEMLSVPGRGEHKLDSLAWRAKQYWKNALIVHRLDMSTSGILVLARNPEIHRELSIAFAERRIHKRYTAVVAGVMSPPAAQDGWGLIDKPLILDWDRRPLHIVDNDKGKPSQTKWRILPAPSGAPHYEIAHTRLDLEPVTGRTHQLRVHLQSVGHTMLGDPLYATGEVLQAAPRLLLHARELGFTHPVSGKELFFEVPAEF
ncbi:RluA family pseudouridine synthase [Lampropedia puyangensis]|uniref:RluA family pseudouridine synthase n=1 Tax=Lampropedia puyangensis TaxID=1330072 RepID=A0A4S8EYJ3_9BURK|nr:RluA family pseudouridine synthase [Lampropedia puyangensis]THT97831.1 RluA family pseudouridine synthase [Lampropedia puyangensis]